MQLQKQPTQELEPKLHYILQGYQLLEKQVQEKLEYLHHLLLTIIPLQELLDLVDLVI